MQDGTATLMVLQLLRETVEELKGLREDVRRLHDVLARASLTQAASAEEGEIARAFEILAQPHNPRTDDED